MPSVSSSPRSAQFSLAEILEATDGNLYQPIPEEVSQHSGPIHTDTRTLQPGDWFLALVGEHFDGHQFLETAAVAVSSKEGVVGGLIISATETLKTLTLPRHFPIVVVNNTLEAYLALGRHHRHRHPDATVVGITGSSGKTTTKELLLAALSPLCKVQATALNHNNEVGVAQTLCSLQPTTDVLIVEMGMRGLGQIEPLSKAACPNVVGIVNIGPAHIGLLGSLEAIAQAKSEIVVGLSTIPSRLCPHPTVVIPANSPQLWSKTTSSPSQTLQSALNSCPMAPHSVATQPSYANHIQHTVQGTSFNYGGTPIQLAIPGQHLVENALLVIAIGQALGFTTSQLAPGLAAYQPVQGRWEPSWFQASPTSTSPSCLIQDAYNANPDSMLASLKTLEGIVSASSRCLLVLAGMKELGHLSNHYHQALGEWLIASRLIHQSDVVLLGEEMDSTREVLVAAGWNPTSHLITGTPCDEILNTLTKDCQQYLTKDTAPCWVLLKGSRFYRLDALGSKLLEGKLLVGSSSFLLETMGAP
ncbi:MAG: UDP-N-acetylmuramoyl-tripeptide--D-alanyl-D-alanine ligase [Vampirovibrionales bacterium]|nr:UDP-N-acetylmuramoyl-tripeptide--D-alanyl-D-alanine ligase [Vampirovibrionales bacterium]